MKIELTSRNRIPHGGMYEWTDPMTKVTVKGINWDMLINRAYDERRANGVATGLEFEQEVERDLCRDYPAECKHNDPSLPSKRRIGFGDVVRGTEVMIAHKLAGSPLVSQDEANRRAKICSECEFNVTFSMPCGGLCASLQKLVIAVVGAKSTPYDSNVKSCAVCKCFSRAAVWLPLEVQCISVTPEMKTQFANIRNCWKAECR